MGNHCTYKGLTIPEIDNLLEPYAEKTYKKLLDKYNSSHQKERLFPEIQKDLAYAYQQELRDVRVLM